MRKILFGVVITLIVLFSFKYCGDKKNERIVLQETSMLIQEQLKNVGKLVVTEGHYSEVFNYKNSKDIFGDFFTSEKHALVVVNAKITIAYDLNKIEYEIDETNKVLRLISIPEEEISINPDLEYYDVQSDFLNPFEAEDYNTIKDEVVNSLRNKIETSDLKSNAENRLISELSKFYILTSSLGWTLEYRQNPIETLEELQGLKL